MLYFFLRSFNTGLTVLWGFALTAIMVRALGVEGYSPYVVIAAIGIYLSIADIGISNLIYARLRREYLEKNTALSEASASFVYTIFWSVVVIATLLFISIDIILSEKINFTEVGSKSLFFLMSVVNLPWNLLKSISNATENYVKFEFVDSVRRLTQIGLLCLILLDIPIPYVFALINAIWLLAFLSLTAIIRAKMKLRIQMKFSIIFKGFSNLRVEYGASIIPSLTFSLSEFAIYNYPYIYIPVVYGGGYEIVVFDIFYKFFRGIISINRVVSASFVPALTRSYHTGDAKRTSSLFIKAMLLSLSFMAFFSCGVFWGREEIFRILLKDASLVSGLMVLSIVIVGFANAMQNTSGSFVLGVGGFKSAQNLSLLFVCIMIICVAYSSLMSVSLEYFILMNSVVFLVSGFLWTFFAGRIIWRMSMSRIKK